MTRIAFIGGGKMAEALLAQLKPAKNIIVSDVNSGRLAYLKKKYKLKTTADNNEAFAFGDIVILAVKPQNMAAVLPAGRPSTNKLVVSIAAGIPLKFLEKKLPKVAVIRVMPNNPCLIGLGISALSKGKVKNSKLYKKAKSIFTSVGEVVELPEKLLDAVTGLSGSGPAYVYQFLAGLIDAGKSAGLPKALAKKLAIHTLIGASATLFKTGKSPEELIKMVASPGGTTIEGLRALKAGQMNQSLKKAVLAASKKSKVISKKWAK